MSRNRNSLSRILLGILVLVGLSPAMVVSPSLGQELSLSNPIVTWEYDQVNPAEATICDGECRLYLPMVLR